MLDTYVFCFSLAMMVNNSQANTVALLIVFHAVRNRLGPTGDRL